MAVPLSLAIDGFASSRVWTEEGSGRTVAGALLGIERGNVIVRDKRGVRLVIPLERLSGGDRVFIEDWQEGRSDQERLPPPIWPESVRLHQPDSMPLGKGSERKGFQSRSFAFYCDEPISGSLTNDFVRTAEGIVDLIAALPIQFPRERKGQLFQVEILKDRAAFEAAGGLPGSGGVYVPQFGGREGVVLVPLESFGVSEFGGAITKSKGYENRVLRHEIAHQILGDWGAFLPGWLSEGVAEYISLLPFSGQGFLLGPRARTAAIQRHFDYYEGIDPGALPGERGRGASKIAEWVLPLAEVVGEGDRPRLDRGEGFVAAHKFYLTAFVLTNHFFHHDGKGEARRIRHFLGELGEAREFFYTRGKGGRLPQGLEARRGIRPRDVQMALVPILWGGRELEEIEGEIHRSLGAIGVRMFPDSASP